MRRFGGRHVSRCFAAALPMSCMQHAPAGLAGGSAAAIRGYKTASQFGAMNAAPFESQSLPELGEINSTPLEYVRLAELEGPWIVVADKLQGEMFIDMEGFCRFRPTDSLGHGIGRLALKKSATGALTFSVDLELYRYQQTDHQPPAKSQRLKLSGSLARVVTSAQQYTTLTLTGHVHTENGVHMGSMNAAKMEPWDRSAFAEYRPDSQIEEGFKQIFSNPFSFSTPFKKLDLEKYRVGPVNSVFYVPNFISAQDELACIRQIEATPRELKKDMDRRIVQEFGGTMCSNCNSSFVADLSQPPWSLQLSDGLVESGVFTPATFPNNVRIHEYAIGHGIAPHVDGPIYVPRVAILSLQSSVLMKFYPYRKPHADAMEHYNDTFRFDGEISKDRPLFSCVLEPRSLLIFEDDAYYFHPHGISAESVDSLDESVAGPIANRELLSSESGALRALVRAPRVGVTVRNLLPRCNHQPERSEYCMKRFWKTANPNAVGPSDVVAKANPPSAYAAMSRPPSTPNPDCGMAELSRKIDDLIKAQTELKDAVRQLQTVNAHAAAQQLHFQSEVSAVLDHLSHAVMEVKASTEDTRRP